MKLRIYLLASLVALGALNAPVMAAPDDVQTLLKLEQTWIDASRAGDTATLNALIDDAYVADTPHGKEDKKNAMQTPSPDVTQSLQNLNAHVDGDRGVVFGDNILTYGNGKRAKISFVDKFERKDGRWRIVSSFVTN